MMVARTRDPSISYALYKRILNYEEKELEKYLKGRVFWDSYTKGSYVKPETVANIIANDPDKAKRHKLL